MINLGKPFRYMSHKAKWVLNIKKSNKSPNLTQQLDVAVHATGCPKVRQAMTTNTMVLTMEHRGM